MPDAILALRWTVTKRIIDRLRQRPELAGVQIEPGFPGDTLEPEAVWVDELAGEITVPVTKAAGQPVARDDNFTIPLEVRVAGKSDLDATMTRLLEITSEIELSIAGDSELGQLDGLVTARVGPEVRLTTAQIKAVGYLGFAEITVSVFTAYRS